MAEAETKTEAKPAVAKSSIYVDFLGILNSRRLFFREQ